MAALQRREPEELEAAAAPLLHADCSTLGQRGARWHRRAQVALGEWWAVTTNPDFLSSAISRRGTWGVLLPLVAGLFGVLLDSFNGGPWQLVAVDSVICLLAFPLDRLPRGALRSDVAIGSWMILWAMAASLVSLACGSESYTITTGAASSMVGLIVLYCGGVHSSVIALCAVALTLFFAAIAGPPQTCLALVAGALITSGAAFQEYRSAELFELLRRQLLATKELLDSAGDGFCSLDATSRRIAHASPKLQRTFASPRSLEGVCFDELVVPADRERLRELCAAAKAAGTSRPVLVTCTSPGSGEGEAALTFDAKLLPHLTCTDEFSLCIQVQGEVRRGPTVPASAQPARAERSLGSLSLSISAAGSQAGLSRRSDHTVRRGLRISAATQTASSPPQLPQAEEGSAASPVSLRMFRMRLKSRQRLLPHFRETPACTVEHVVFTAMRSINPRGRGCCAWHVLALVLMREARKQLLEPCRPRFLPKQSFQCPACFAMNEGGEGDDDDDEELECSVCMAPCRLPTGGSDIAPSSDASAADDEVEAKGDSER